MLRLDDYGSQEMQGMRTPSQYKSGVMPEVRGSYEGKKIDISKINFLATLPSLEAIRGKLLGLLSAPAQKIASVVQVPAGQLTRIMSIRSEQLEKSN